MRFRSGSRLECFFNDPQQGWNGTRWVERRALEEFPNVNFSDPRVKWADMTADGLQDIALVYDGNVEYWPNLGYGDWGKRIHMRNSPRFPYGYDPKRILLGDVDGDGMADLVYVDDVKVTLWINQSGNGWSDPIVIKGTPRVSDMDAVRLADVLGTGVSGVLWSADASGLSRQHMFFLDFTGGNKPYLLHEMDNHIGAVTRVAYAPSTRFYLEDQKRPETRWTTPLPFPVQVVARVEAIDAISGGKLTTEYRYHHGYWDGAEREFRGFGRVDQRDTEVFQDFHATGTHPPDRPFNAVPVEFFSSPTETRTWFHQGPIGDEFGGWEETDFSHEFWSGDPQVLSRPQAMTEFLRSLPRRVKRDALRTLRGHVLRTELYALDGREQQTRPYTVTEQVYGVREVPAEAPPGSGDEGRQHIFFPHALAQRTTHWERGHDPMTQFTFTDDYDPYGQPRSQISIAVPRGRDFRVAATTPSEPYLATQSVTGYAQRDDAQVLIVDRVSRTTSYEIVNDGRSALLALKTAIENGTALRNLISQTINFYDGEAFKGLPVGQIGTYGALTRTENLVLTEDILDNAYKSGSAIQTPPEEPPYLRINRVNVALAANGATAVASSLNSDNYSPSSVINGDRKGLSPSDSIYPAMGGMWMDDTPSVFPDWIAIDLHGAKTINEIDVFTAQDNLYAPIEPTAELTFTLYGISDFQVQTWNGSQWVTVPGGNVTGNNKVWRKFTFPDITTSMLRVFVQQAANGRYPYSRIVEIEAYDSATHVNVALAKNGASATASSTFNLYRPAFVIDGDRKVNWWNDGTLSVFPDSIEVDLNGDKVIDEIDVFTVQDTPSAPLEPTQEMTFTHYGITKFEVQCWNGSDFVPVGSVAENNRVWRRFTFPSITTSKLRVVVHDSADHRDTRITEVEAYGYATGSTNSEEYPAAFLALLPATQATDPTRPGLYITPVGYGFASGDTIYARGYFAATERRRYDFHDDPGGKGLLKTARDPLGRDTSIVYDDYELLPTAVTDAARLTTSAVYNYRVLQPQEVTDPSGNRTAYTFTPLGLLESTAVMGKADAQVGDTLAAPGITMVYDFQAFSERQQPISVRTIKRVHHINDTDVPQPQRDDTIESLEYSDGFGRLLQARTQAEDVLFGDLVFGGAVLPDRQDDQQGTQRDVVGRPLGPAEPPQVMVSGWQVYDNKGRVVEKYEPFFASSWDYAPPIDGQYGQMVTMYYDALGRVIRTGNPDGSEQRVIYGIPIQLDDPPLDARDTEKFSPTPWEIYTYDTNDNAGRTHHDASLAYQHHWNTPVSAEVDARGRTIRTVARNGPDPATDWYTTRSTYDIRGNLLTVTDALGRVAFKHVYDLANRPLRLDSLDAGTRRSVLDAAGNVIEGRDSKGALVLHGYDVLNRPIRLWARDGSGQPLTLRERLVYGDSPDAGLTVAQATVANLLGKPYRHYDEAGLLTSAAYDFKGNLLEKRRQVVADSAILAVFNPPPPNWAVKAFRVNWEPLGAPPLDAMEYTTTLTYDALNRVKTMQYPQDVAGTRKTLRPHYNRAGALESVKLDDTTYVERIAYNAKGQRTLIAYSNGIMTRHAYDQNFRLIRMRTERYSKPAPLTYHSTGTPLQDFAYGYDLVGNVLNIQDRTPGCGVLNNPDALAYPGHRPGSGHAPDRGQCADPAF
jgi:hypothetical protein